MFPTNIDTALIVIGRGEHATAHVVSVGKPTRRPRFVLGRIGLLRANTRLLVFFETAIDISQGEVQASSKVMDLR